MTSLLVLFLLSQPTTGGGAQPVVISNPTNPRQQATLTTSGGKTLLDVNCPTCSGGGGGSGGDGGYTVVVQGPNLNDGGLWVSTPPTGSASLPGACTTVTTTTTVLTANPARRGASICARIQNTDTTFVRFGPTATTFSFPLEPGQCFNLSFPGSIYTGTVDVVANSGTQIVCAVEFQ